MIGKKVYSIDGPGQSPRDGLAGSVGTVTGEHADEIWGDSWVVTWHEGSKPGHKESFYKHQLEPASKKRGIGVYYDDTCPTCKGTGKIPGTFKFLDGRVEHVELTCADCFLKVCPRCGGTDVEARPFWSGGSDAHVETWDICVPCNIHVK